MWISSRRSAASMLVMLALVGGFLTATTGTAAAAACRDTSYIPSINPGLVVHRDGRRFQIQKKVVNRQPTVLAWENGRALGRFAVPASFYGGQISAINKIGIVFETRFGRVEQVQKVRQVLRICDPGWTARF